MQVESFDVVFYRHSLLSRGGDKMTLVQAAGLAAHGHRVVIVVNRVETVFPWPASVARIDIPLPGKVGSLAWALLKGQSARKVVADIIPMATLLALRNWKRVIYYCQDFDESYYSGRAGRFLIRGFYRVGLTLLRIPVIAVAGQLAAKLKPFGSSPYVVRNGVDLRHFYPDPDPALALAAGKTPAILIFCRPDFRKGSDIALEVASRLKSTMAGRLQVWSVGDLAAMGPRSPVLDRSFGVVEADRLRAILSSCTLFLYPTRHEGLPLMVLEAMACGCPVIASTASAEVIQHGENGLMAPIEDVEMTVSLVLDVLASSEMRERLRKAGLETAARMSMLTSQEEFFETLGKI